MTTREYLQANTVTDSTVDVTLLDGIISTLADNDVEFELHNFDNSIFISVKGFGKIVGNRLPLIVESIFGGYDPEHTQTDEFVELIDNINTELQFGAIHYEHIQDPDSDYDGDSGATHLLNDLASLQNGGKLASFVETTIYYNSEVSTLLSGEPLMELLKNRESEKVVILDRLKKYLFDDEPAQKMAVTNKTDKDYFTFNVDNSALLVVQTGSGKTELVSQYMSR